MGSSFKVGEGMMEHELKDEEPTIEQRSFDFALRIVRLCQQLDERPGVARTLSRQLLRAGTSIGANVAESQAAQSRPDFLTKLTYAQKEARETHYWLRLLSESHILESRQLASITEETMRIIKILSRIIISTKKNDNP